MIAGGVAGVTALAAIIYLAATALQNQWVKKEPQTEQVTHKTHTVRAPNIPTDQSTPRTQPVNLQKPPAETFPFMSREISENPYFKAVSTVNPVITDTLHAAFEAPKRFIFTDNSKEILSQDIAETLDARFPTLKEKSSPQEVENVLSFIKDGGLFSDLVEKNRQGNPGFYSDASLVTIKSAEVGEKEKIKLTNFRIKMLCDKLEATSKYKYQSHVENQKNKPK